LFESRNEVTPTSWSHDGRLLLFQIRDPGTRNDLWALTLPGDGKPTPFIKTDFNEETGRFSPDAHWVVYTSDESGRNEIYATPFPGPGRRWQVSTSGGTLPRWSADGSEIFFISATRQLTAVPVQARDGQLEVSSAKPLFGNLYGGIGVFYDVTPDGRRFLVNT